MTRLHPLAARDRAHVQLSGQVRMLDDQRVTVLAAALDPEDRVEVLFVEMTLNRTWRTLPLDVFLKASTLLPLERPLDVAEAGLPAFIEAWGGPLMPVHRAVAARLTPPQARFLAGLALEFRDELDGRAPAERAGWLEVTPEENRICQALAQKGLIEIDAVGHPADGRPIAGSITLTSFGWKVMRALLDRVVTKSAAA